MRESMSRNTIMWISIIGLFLGSAAAGSSNKDVVMDIVASPSVEPVLGEELQLQCSVRSAFPVPSSCGFHWTHAYFPTRNGPITETFHHPQHTSSNSIVHHHSNNNNNNNYKSNSGAGEATNKDGEEARVLVYHISASSSVLVVPHMHSDLDGLFRCALVCNTAGSNGKDGESTLAEASIQIRMAEGSSLLVKKDLAMMMISAVVIVFVACMLLAGLVLRLRQCHAQREFNREQERRQGFYTDLVLNYDKYSTTTSSSTTSTIRTAATTKDAPPPPPRYSQIIETDGGRIFVRSNSRENATADTRTLCFRQISSEGIPRSQEAATPTGPPNVIIQCKVHKPNKPPQQQQQPHLKDTTCENTTPSNPDQKQDTSIDIDNSPVDKSALRIDTTTNSDENSITDCRKQTDSPLEEKSPNLHHTPENLYSLMDQSDLSGVLDHGVLAFHPLALPDYEDVVLKIQNEKHWQTEQCTCIHKDITTDLKHDKLDTDKKCNCLTDDPELENRVHNLSTLPPSYSQLSLHV